MNEITGGSWIIDERGERVRVYPPTGAAAPEADRESLPVVPPDPPQGQAVKKSNRTQIEG